MNMGIIRGCQKHYQYDYYYRQILLVITRLIVLFLSSQLIAASGSNTVHYLPAVQGPLPFHLQTGYVGVGSGGPACSSFSGLIFEIGPIAFKVEEYKGTLPNLTMRPHAWTKVSSIIFADLPVGTGFSYSKAIASPQPSDWKLVHQAHRFLRKWLIDNPEFLSNEVYIGGDSYSGIPVPVLVQEISTVLFTGNEKGIQPWINVQGYVLGNALTTNTEHDTYMIPFLHGIGIVPDELYKSFYEHCEEDKKSVACIKDIDHFYKLISGLDLYNILDPKCEAPREVSSNEKTQLFLPTPPLSCGVFVYYLAKYWANDDNVRKAFHIRKGSIGKWRRCFDGNYKSEIVSSFEYHLNLSAKGFRSLIYNGDHDPIISFMATQARIRNLNYTILDDWRPWLVQDQVAGYTKTYSNQVTFATVKGAGHIAPEYKSEECFSMFSRWKSNKPL